MTATIKWSIDKLTRVLKDDYVMAAYYICEAADGDHKDRVLGRAFFKKPSTLIPYTDLTEEQVVGWVKESLNTPDPTKVDTLEKKLIELVNERKTPTKADGVPWT